MKPETQQKCHCWQPLHYTDKKLEQQLKELVEKLGEFITIQVGKRSWKVQRHYVALHGIKGENIDQLGFEEITQ